MPDFSFKPANCAAQVQTLEEFNQTCLKVTQIPNHTNQAELFVQVDASECEVVTCIASATVNPTLSHQDWILRRPVQSEFVFGDCHGGLQETLVNTLTTYFSHRAA